MVSRRCADEGQMVSRRCADEGQRIALVDYGAGNLTSVRKALSAIGAAFWTPDTPAELARASGIIVPGVGHFSSTARLDASWREAIRGAVSRSVPLLGICVGLQWLFEGSTEAPEVPGLGVISGQCTLLPSDGIKVPHVGWNTLQFPKASRLFEGVAPDAHVYFTHSYAAPVVSATAAATTYGVPFSAAVEEGLVSGVQFHPEKSGDVGLRILRNWASELSSS
jgi:glutamine amidotransferase